MTNEEFIDRVLSKTFWGSFVFLNCESLSIENFEGIFYNGELIDDEDDLEILMTLILSAMKSRAVESIEDNDAIWKRYPIELLENGDVLDSSIIENEPTHDIFFVIFLNDNTWEIQVEEIDSDFQIDDSEIHEEPSTDDGIDIYVNPDEIDE